MADGINNGPDTNIAHVVNIEGLLSQVNEQIQQLNSGNQTQTFFIDTAVESLADFQQDIFQLRKAFEK